jgi:hypothetical protein
MRTRSAIFVAVILAGIILAIGFHYREQGPPAGSFSLQPPDIVNERLLALMENASATFAIGERAKSADCATDGPLPDPACTPGAIFADATPSTICVAGYTQTVRNVPVNLKAQVYTAYGLSYPQETGAYETDHLIPLELGGDNDIANLFPQPAVPTPGYHEKDLVENYLHDEVCAGTIGLAAAQKQIANDWVAVYDVIAPEDLTQLRQEAAR